MLLSLDLDGLGLRQFLILVREQLMSVRRLRMRLIYGLGVLWVGLLDYQLLTGGVHLVLGHWLGLYRSQSIGLRNRCTRSFSIIGVLWFLLLKLGY